MIARGLSAGVRVAIIGASCSGSAAARVLGHPDLKGLDVTVLERSKRAGGRCSTRVMEETKARFDHGATYVRPKSAEFRAILEELKEEGGIQEWEITSGSFDFDSGNFSSDNSKVYIGNSGMADIPKTMLSKTTKIVYCAHVVAKRDEEGQWEIHDRDDGEKMGKFDWIICADRGVSLELRGQAVDDSLFVPSIAVMVTLASSSKVKENLRSCQTLLVKNHDILSYVCENSAKNGRKGDMDASSISYVLQSTPGFAESIIKKARSDPSNEGSERLILEAIRLEAAELLLKAFYDTVTAVGGQPLDDHPLGHTFLQAHRWGRGFPDPTSTVPCGSCEIDTDINLVSVGDYFAECYPGKVEGAVLSGTRGAEKLLTHLRSESLVCDM